MRSNGVAEMSVEEIAMGFIRVANETMCRPIRNLTQGKGYGELNLDLPIEYFSMCLKQLLRLEIFSTFEED
jgi:hypothetical protein